MVSFEIIYALGAHSFLKNTFVRNLNMTKANIIRIVSVLSTWIVELDMNIIHEPVNGDCKTRVEKWFYFHANILFPL